MNRPIPAPADVIDALVERNRRFAALDFGGPAPLVPALRTVVVGCVDPRVEPARVLGLDNGEAVVIRNVAGRVTPNFFEQMLMLRLVAMAEGGDPGDGWNLVVLHHTDCGITRLAAHVDLLAGYFGRSVDELADVHVTDPWASVVTDVAALRANPFFPAAFTVSGLVYDVDTGTVEVVVPPARLRDE